MFEKKTFSINVEVENKKNLDKNEIAGPLSYNNIAWDKENEKKKENNKGKGKLDGDVGFSSISGLFRYADRRDIVLMVVGFLFAMLSGTLNPVMSIVFGHMTQVFISANKYLYDPRFRMNKTELNFFNQQHFGSTGGDSSLPKDFITEQEFLSYVTKCSLIFLIIAVLSFTSTFSQVYCWEVSCENQIYKLRKVYFSQILRQDIGWYDENEEGDLSSKLTDDFERMKYGLGSKVPMITQYLTQFFVGLIVGFCTNWHLTLILCFGGPLLLAASALSGSAMAGTAKREQLRYGVAGGIAVEVLTSIKTIAAFGLEKLNVKRYDSAMDEGRKLAMSKYYVLSVGMSLSFGVTYGIYALGFWYGSTLYLAHQIQPGQIFTIFFSVLVAAFSIGNSLPIIAEISNAIGSSSNVFSIIDRIPKIDPYSKEGEIYENVEGRIEFKSVRFSYPTRPDVQILKGLDINIEPGKVIALVGSSGAGKSTIVGLLMRFYDPFEGKICIDGHELDKVNLNWLRKQIGVVAQEPILFGTSISENIRYGDVDVTQEDIINAAKLANAHTFIKTLPKGYDTEVGDLGTMMSGGQKQRIAIARALVRNPKILLLDEATSALDAESERIVQAALERAMKGRTTIIIAHRLTTIRNVDTIYAMQDGMVIESGTHDELMEQKGLYHNLVMMQNKHEDELPEPLPELKRVLGSVRRSRSRRSSSKSVHSIHLHKDDILTIDGEDPGFSYVDIFKLSTTHWPLVLVTVLGCTLAGFNLPFFSLIYSEVIQVFTLTSVPEFQRQVMFWCGMFGSLAIVVAADYFICVLSSSVATEKLIQLMRAKTFENLLSQQVCWFDEEQFTPLRLANILAKDPPYIKSTAGMRAGVIIINIVTLLAAVAITFYSSWRLGLIICLFTPLIIISSWKQLSHRVSQYKNETESLEDSSKLASECIQNIRTVQLLGLQSHVLTKYGETLGASHAEAKAQAIYFSISYAISQCMLFLVYSAAFHFGSEFVDEELMSFVDIYRIVFAIGFSFPAIGMGCLYLQDFIKGKDAVTYVFKLMKLKSSLNTFAEDGMKPEVSGKVTFRNVEFKYPNRKRIPILQGLNLTIKPGQTVALVGGSGCGKSTIISLLERFYSPDSGQIMLDDIDISLINLAHLRSHMGLVTQEPVLFDSSIKDNISAGAEALGIKVTDQMIIDAAKIANIHNFISRLPEGYETLAGEKGTQLSGGQKQRIAIARALIRNPKILLLDEATSALDNESEKIVQEALDKARKGRTTIIIAHRLSTIRDADCIVVIHNGRVVEQGTHNELKAQQGHYFNLIKMQEEKGA